MSCCDRIASVMTRRSGCVVASPGVVFSPRRRALYTMQFFMPRRPEREAPTAATLRTVSPTTTDRLA